MQEAFARAAAGWRRVSDYDAPEAWVRRVAMNLVTDSWRRRKAALRRQPEPAPSVSSEDWDDVLDLVAALRQLPRFQREAIVLFYIADMSLEDVAHQLKRPAGTVKSDLARGRDRLRTLLREGAA